ncbi:MAG: anthranilate synthase component II [Phycisphaerae bacterium]
MIVVIDNYDSFTYNLVQCLGEIGLEHPELKHDIVVWRNDAVTVDQIAERGPDRLIISPGPCTPREAGISTDVVKALAGDVPILGVCLGHQCIAAAFGAVVTRAARIMHGKTSEIHHDGKTIFRGLANPFTATRYHSLIVPADTLPPEIEVSAHTEQGECMAIRHRHARLEGVQFHPESFLTTAGKQLLTNFLAL